ncbi:ATP-dependent RNA helicase DbpA [Marinimicrobium sp. ABcell2]|uniref:ATP-dependent RNA helicase DbpA n=1 Tax=Marinimicrobium sp. ABcell2 TaxID=3069751 RepID=UPI0027B3978E|nr:ATP-dependent RNA helicase DbpA [Marinimicrobium sp. ABcell2]MDQ2076071.1 ATP-dependent RNA helicase DbpA [Marinimicrobium sp. ABcell2]
MSETAFASLSLKPELLKNLDALGYATMTPIQAQSLPHVLAGRDVIAQAKTGSGKTAAFGLAVLQNLDVSRFRIQALVLCPTRELADQVARELRQLGRLLHNIKILTLCGGTPFGPQIHSLSHGAHIIVGTPGRVEEHLRKQTLSLESLTTFVLDEADRMLDMGFQESLDKIAEYVPTNRQTLLFSATYPDEISDISARVTRDPERITVTNTHTEATIRQELYWLSDDAERSVAVRLLLLTLRPESALVFCNTKRETRELAEELRRSGFKALALHGDLEQNDRDRTLSLFTNRSASVLVATDVAARGLDIEKLDAVINYHLAREPEVHVHRIGRTGRAGGSGRACSLAIEREAGKVERLEAYLGAQIDKVPLPPRALLGEPAYLPPMVTLQIGAGKKQKLRPGDILGALTGAGGIKGDQVGKIVISDSSALVAVSRRVLDDALDKLSQGKLKGRSFRVRRVDS